MNALAHAIYSHADDAATQALAGKRILLVGAYAGDRGHSMNLFARLLKRELMAKGVAVTLLEPPDPLGRWVKRSRGLRKWVGYLDKFAIFPVLLRRAARHYDVVHICDHSNAMYRAWLQDVPDIITCHDLIGVHGGQGLYQEHRVRFTGRLLQRWVARHLGRAEHVACVSEFTRGALSNTFPQLEPRASVVPNGLNYAYSPMPAAQADTVLSALGLAPGDTYVMHVGHGSWRKNRLGVLKIFSRYLALQPSSVRLVMVGDPLDEPMRAYLATQDWGRRVVQLSDLAPEAMRALYSRAQFLLFPSLHEGFGWPIIEAQSCGCVVVTSNRAPMNEVGGEGAIYIDPERHVDAAAVIIRELRHADRWRAAALSNAQRYSAACMAAGYARAYAALLAQREETGRISLSFSPPS